jgi:hypothetical protein
MARHARLKRAVAGLVLGVLLAHAVAIGWIADRLQQAQAAAQRTLPAVMYTRVLQPLAAAPPPAAKPPRAPATVVRRPRRAAPPDPAPPAPPAPPVPPAPAPPPESAAVAAVAASAPEPAVAAEPIAPTQPPAAVAAASAPAIAAAPQAAASAPAPDPWPADTRLTYRLGGQFRSGPLFGDARVLWQREGTRYQVRVEVDITLWAHWVMASQGDIGPDGLVPRSYAEERRNHRRAVQMGESVVTYEGGRTAPRPAGVQDTASQFVELGHRFAIGAVPLRVGTPVEVWLARPGGVDLWTYDVVGVESLQLAALGTVQAYHLKPRLIRGARGNITAEFWYAPALQYLPVRVRINMGDRDHLDLSVEEIEQR